MHNKGWNWRWSCCVTNTASSALDTSTGWTVAAEWRGMARYRAERLAPLWRPLRAALDRGAKKTAITLPDELGVFAAPAKRS